jgi:hypothetical protein
METFIPAKQFVVDSGFIRNRQNLIEDLSVAKIDPPISGVINLIKKIPYCFSIQSCYGHFIYAGKDLLNTDPLPELPPAVKVDYRIAFMALAIEDSSQGRELYDELCLVPQMDGDYIQFGCAEWFWNLYKNSYILQVCPERFRTKDSASVSYPEALHIEKVRNLFVEKLEELFKRRTLSKEIV